MRSTLAHFLLLALPNLIAALLFGGFSEMVQQDHLGGGIAQLLIFASLAIGATLWVVGILLAVPLKRQSGGLIDLAICTGAVFLLVGLAALVFRWLNPPADPFSTLSFNWPYLAVLSVYAGTLTLTGTAVLRVRTR